MDVTKYPEVSQKQYKEFPNKLSETNVRLLSALFDERKGISSTELGGKAALKGFMKQYAAREEYEKYRKGKGPAGMKKKKLKNKPKILTKMTGRMNRTWMLQYVNEFGPRKIRGRADELSYDELRLETQKIADTLGPLLDAAGGGKGAFYGTQVLLHHTKKRKFKREEIELVSPPTSSTVVPEAQIQAIEEDEDAEDDPEVFQNHGGVDFHAMPSLGAASPQMVAAQIFEPPKPPPDEKAQEPEPETSLATTLSDISTRLRSGSRSMSRAGSVRPSRSPSPDIWKQMYDAERTEAGRRRIAQKAIRAAQPVRDMERRTSLRVENVYRGATGHTSYTHLIEGDLAPVGRVHLVKMGALTGDQRDNHILSEMDADANMGAHNLREQSRRGPFKRSGGRSRVLDRSAHVSYRQRGRTLEITVRRGVTDYEMSTLIGKLSAHRMASGGSIFYFIRGNSKQKVGTLDRVDMEKLRTKIEDTLLKTGVVGLLIQDLQERGTLHKAYSHGMQMKENFRTLNVFPSK